MHVATEDDDLVTEKFFCTAVYKQSVCSGQFGFLSFMVVKLNKNKIINTQKYKKNKTILGIKENRNIKLVSL